MCRRLYLVLGITCLIGLYHTLMAKVVLYSRPDVNSSSIGQMEEAALESKEAHFYQTIQNIDWYIAPLEGVELEPITGYVPVTALASDQTIVPGSPLYAEPDPSAPIVATVDSTDHLVIHTTADWLQIAIQPAGQVGYFYKSANESLASSLEPSLNTAPADLSTDELSAEAAIADSPQSAKAFPDHVFSSTPQKCRWVPDAIKDQNVTILQNALPKQPLAKVKHPAPVTASTPSPALSYCYLEGMLKTNIGGPFSPFTKQQAPYILYGLDGKVLAYIKPATPDLKLALRQACSHKVMLEGAGEIVDPKKPLLLQARKLNHM